MTLLKKIKMEKDHI